MSVLKLHKHVPFGRPNPRKIPALVQIGWIGQTGEVYALDDQPMDDREKGGYQPLLMTIGEWEYNPDDEGYDFHED